MTWQIKKLGNICDFQRGLTYSKKDEVDFSNKVVLRANNINMQDNTLDFTDLRYIRDEIEIPENKITMVGSLLICTASGSKSHLGKVARIDQEYGYAFGGFMGQIVPRKDVDSKYLFYVFVSDAYKELIANLSSGVNINNLKFDDLKDFEIPLPSFPEQRRIVKILDEVFVEVAKAKENAEKSLKNSKELFESYLQSVFEKPASAKGPGVAQWEERRLDEVCEISSKLVNPRKKEYLDLTHVGGGNIEANNGILLDLKTAREEKLISGKFIFDETMVLYSKIRPYLMKVVRPDFIGLCSADIYPLSPLKGKIVRDYLFYLLLSKPFTQYAIKGSGRAGMPKVNREHLFAYRFFVPSISEQKAIVKKLDALSAETKKLEGIYAKKLADLEELKKSVLRKAFAGEL